MQFDLKSKHIVLTDALKDYITKKLSRVQKHFEPVFRTEVMLSASRGFHVADVKVHAKGGIFQGIEKTDDMYCSIDKVVDKLERQLQKHKEKLKNHHKSRKNQAELFSEIAEISPDGSDGMAVRRQKLSTCIPEEAAKKMANLGFSFYLFRNKDSREVNVVYRRENGNVAIIEPEI